MKVQIGAPYVAVIVSGERRRIDGSLWAAMRGQKPEDPSAFRSNGCTLSPDHLRSIPLVGRWAAQLLGDREIWPACFLHDFHTSPAVATDRVIADFLLRENVGICLMYQRLARPLALWVARAYWTGVRRLGRSRYSGQGDPDE